jgi:hypothetical protein
MTLNMTRCMKLKTCGCKQDTTNQHDYFKKVLYVFFPKKTFSC